jgi:hypothetical protein
VWQIPDAVDTVVCAPDDGWKYHPKHVEQFPNINKLCDVASWWIYTYIGILLGAHLILHIRRIRVNHKKWRKEITFEIYRLILWNIIKNISWNRGLRNVCCIWFKVGSNYRTGFSGSKKGKELLNQPRRFYRLAKDSAAWRLSVG